MATTQLSASRSIPRAANAPPSRYKPRNPLLRFTEFQRNYVRIGAGGSRVYAARDVGRGDSYLDMWKKAKERERKSLEFERMLSSTGSEVEIRSEQGGVISGDELEKKNSDFMKMLEIPVEERDRVQRMQVIDRAAAAIAAAKALLEENKEVIVDDYGGGEEIEGDQGMHNKTSLSIQSDNFSTGTPGPSFWAWTPPSDDDNGDVREVEISPSLKLSPSPLKAKPVLEKEREYNILSIPFETSMNQNQSINLSIPPLQSLVEFQNREANSAQDKTLHMDEENEINIEFLTQAAEAVDALSKSSEEFLSQGVYEDGSMWWKETGVEERPDGVVCRWTLTRGVSADKSIEWENKYWEASDEFGYKELGSEKSGRDAVGNVWREYWSETMTQDQGVVSLEKTADKWGKNAHGTEWQEKWSEHYGASGTDKWAHKWCTIDPNTPLDPGHAHVWHERWGEKYDGHGGSIKYTDKWAERCEGDGWSKWGDKWDENFEPSGHGVKQGESWWQGKYGERWNRTWGEGHNGSGWVHKYGKSSSGEHWDTHVQQDTWYEMFPHFGFYHCFENSVQLRQVKKPSEWS